MEQIPENFLDDHGELNTSALIKSYCELEKKMGSMISVPSDESDDATKQKFNHAIGVPDSASEYPTNTLFDDESVRNKFHEIGLTCKQVEKIYDIAQEFLQPTLKNLFELQSQTNAINELKNFFGSTQKMTDALREIKTFGSNDCIILYMPCSPWGVEHNSSNASDGKYLSPNAFISRNASFILSSSPKNFFNSFIAFVCDCN